MGAVLPKLVWRESPNQSKRTLHKGTVPYLIVVHRPVGSYHGSVDWLCNPKSQASAHIVTEGGGWATQLVPWHMKAWHAMSFNSVSYGLEIDDDAWNGKDHDAFLTAARIVGFLCHRTGIPCKQSTDPLTRPGIVSHYQLGKAGGNHTDPTTDAKAWRRFLAQCSKEYVRGGYRKTWGRGRLRRLSADV